MPWEGRIGFLLVFFGVSYYFAMNKSSVIDRIGKYLTPILLVTLLVIIILAIFRPLSSVTGGSMETGGEAFLNGFLTGYNTGDVGTGIICAGIFIGAFREKGYTGKKEYRLMMLGIILIGFLLLFVVYGGLAYLGAQGTEWYETDVDTTYLLTDLVRRLAGYGGSVVLSLAVIFACLTTAVGMIATTGGWVEEWSKGKIPYKLAALIITVAIFLVSSTGVSNVLAISGPIFTILFPMSVVMTFLGLFKKYVPNDGAWKGAEKDRPAMEGQEIDLQGACVIPGFIDAHMHPVMLADFSKKISALPPRVYSIEDLVEEIRACREKQGPGKWCQGWGYDEGKFAEKRSINRYDLDRGCSDSPVSIIRTCGHIRCVNSKALELAGIDRNTPDPVGGQIERDEKGEPTGVLKETARNLVLPFMPVEEKEETIENLVDLGKLLSSQGIVAVSDMGNLDSSDNFPLYQEAIQRGFRQRVGIYYMWDYFMDNPDFSIPMERRDRKNQIFAAGLKLIGDGSVSGKTAWMEEPYLGDEQSRGISVCTQEQLESALDFCRKNRCQLSFHAMGTKAIARIVERVDREEPWTRE